MLLKFECYRDVFYSMDGINTIVQVSFVNSSANLLYTLVFFVSKQMGGGSEVRF